MTNDPLALSSDLHRADDRLMATMASMRPAAVGEPSRLPGWTRGHVLSHLARNADSLINLLTWAQTGVKTPQYASPDAREAGIAAGAARPLGEQIEDVRAASARFATAAAEMPAEAWAYVLSRKDGSAARVMWRRLREVELHHVDLGCAYVAADWPDAFTQRLLRELVTTRSEPPLALVAEDGHEWQLGTVTPEVTVTGPAHELAAWLSGRSSGNLLTVSPDRPLPTLSAWM